jgi:hypothetical protein
MSPNCSHFCRVGAAEEVVQELERTIAVIEGLSVDISIVGLIDIGHSGIDELMCFHEV